MMSEAKSSHSPNPKQVAAGRRNQQKWKGISPEGLRKLRETALLNKPWKRSTGPRTAAGKARSAANGKTRQKGPKSVREARAEVAGIMEQVRFMRECCPS